jgi:hypothetical protein
MQRNDGACREPRAAAAVLLKRCRRTNKNEKGGPKTNDAQGVKESPGMPGL